MCSHFCLLSLSMCLWNLTISFSIGLRLVNFVFSLVKGCFCTFSFERHSYLNLDFEVDKLYFCPHLKKVTSLSLCIGSESFAEIFIFVTVPVLSFFLCLQDVPLLFHPEQFEYVVPPCFFLILVLLGRPKHLSYHNLIYIIDTEMYWPLVFCYFFFTPFSLLFFYIPIKHI